jgi:hypothetical protein
MTGTGSQVADHANDDSSVGEPRVPPWIVLLFPVWVCVASVYILVAERAMTGPGSGGPTE